MKREFKIVNWNDVTLSWILCAMCSQSPVLGGYNHNYRFIETQVSYIVFFWFLYRFFVIVVIMRMIIALMFHHLINNDCIENYSSNVMSDYEEEPWLTNMQ